MLKSSGVDNSMAKKKNSETFWFPVEEIQTVINGDRRRLNIFIYLLLFDFILLARSLL